MFNVQGQKEEAECDVQNTESKLIVTECHIILI